MAAPLRFDPIDEAGRQWATRFSERFVTPMMAVTSIMRVQQLLLARLNEALAPFGLTFARYEALMLLYFSRAGSLPMGRIGARLQVHPTSVTNLVDRLEQAGDVRREQHPSDGRTTLATLTDRGRTTAEAATRALHDMTFGSGALREAVAEREVRRRGAGVAVQRQGLLAGRRAMRRHGRTRKARSGSRH